MLKLVGKVKGLVKKFRAGGGGGGGGRELWKCG